MPGSATPLPEDVPQVKDRIEAALKITGTKDGKWDFLRGILNETVKRWRDTMLAEHPGWENDTKLVDKVIEKYAHISASDCIHVRFFLGLPAVLFAKKDIDILDDAQLAEKDGTLGKADEEMYQQMAKWYTGKDIIDEASGRVQDEKLDVNKRRAALQEFAKGNWVGTDVADRAMFDGGACTINYTGIPMAFDGFKLANWPSHAP
ncbi:MAG: hypothetical protein WB588_08500 [Dehalococcoidia bacterium]